MKKRVLELLTESGAFLEGHFLLTSGKHSGQYVEKIALLQYPDKVAEICALLAEKVRATSIQFDTVAAPALGGVVLSYEMARQLHTRGIFLHRENNEFTLRSGFPLAENEKILLVEDIVTTGGSIKEVKAALEKRGAEVVAVAALVDRSSGNADFGVPFIPLIEMNIPVYPPDDCPLCQSGEPLVKPGRTGKK